MCLVSVRSIRLRKEEMCMYSVSVRLISERKKWGMADRLDVP